MRKSPEKASDAKQTPSYAKPFSKEVVVIGGGMGGCMSALRLAETGWKVTILESAGELLSRSADKTPGRMGLGFHYADLDTAEKYLRATINFVKRFPGFEISESFPKPPLYLKRGRYFIVKDSLHPSDQILETYKNLKKIYKKLVAEDPNNKQFGDVDKFFRHMDEEEYEAVVNKDIVSKGIQTCEQLLDWPRFKEHFLRELKKNPNITIRTNARVTKPETAPDGRYVLHYSQKGSVAGKQENKFLVTPYVLNCTWQNSESLDVQMKFKSENALDRTNRVKVLARVQLPPTLREMFSSFFLTGPHCMVSNMGDGTALMSFAPITNVLGFAALTLPKAWENLVNNKLHDDDVYTILPTLTQFDKGEPVDFPEKLKEYLSKHTKEERDSKKLLELYFGEQIRDGVSRYIPGMAEAKVLDVQFGIVKTKGEANIYDKNSAFHKRDYSGIEEMRCGWITNDLMKLLYSVDNANEVAQLFEKHHQLDRDICEEALKKACMEAVNGFEGKNAHDLAEKIQSAFVVSRTLLRSTALKHHRIVDIPQAESEAVSHSDSQSSKEPSSASRSSGEYSKSLSSEQSLSSGSPSSEESPRNSTPNRVVLPKTKPVPIAINPEKDELWSQEYGTYCTRSKSDPTPVRKTPNSSAFFKSSHHHPDSTPTRKLSLNK